MAVGAEIPLATTDSVNPGGRVAPNASDPVRMTQAQTNRLVFVFITFVLRDFRMITIKPDRKPGTKMVPEDNKFNNETDKGYGEKTPGQRTI
jgi:hypothetical protein